MTGELSVEEKYQSVKDRTEQLFKHDYGKTGSLVDSIPGSKAGCGYSRKGIERNL